MSYWTHSDLFEEPGPPDRPFHGGFGLMTREGVRKPAWFDAHTAYFEMGSPKQWHLPMRSNDVVLVTLEPALN